MRYNPFRPNSIVGPGMFCGRSEEILTIKQSLHQTKHGNPQHFLVEGERGIGKSSLMLSSSIIANGGLDQAATFRFITIQTELATNTTYTAMLRKIAASLRSELVKRKDLRALASTAWDFLSSWHLFGVEYKKSERHTNPIDIISELAVLIATFINETRREIDGVVILIDEADKPDPAQANLGEFVKLFTERLTWESCDRVCLGLSGLPIIMNKLRQGHESSPRVFNTLDLEPLTAAESKEVVERGILDANRKNERATTITEEALDWIAHLAEGYPHFIPQFAYCSFDHDNDYVIDGDDVIEGAYKENGALDQLGQKYFEELYFDKVASQDYRRVLNAMARNFDAWTARRDIIQTSGVSEHQVTNALNALKARNIIIANEEKRGEYKLPTRSFAVWIRATAEKRAN